MISLFWRILLGGWAIVLLMLGFTLFLSNQVMMTETGPFGEEMARKVAEHVAKDLRAELSRSGVIRETFTGEYDFFTPLLEVYVIDPQNRDLRGRLLPESIRAALAQKESTLSLIPSPHHIERQALDGYTVIAETTLARNAFPFIGVRFLIFLSLSFVASFALARFIVGPVRKLEAASQRMATGDLSVRVAPTVGNRTDEMAQLAHHFDAMARRIESLVDSQQRLMRDVSHELRSPLARLQALLSIARQGDDGVEPLQLAKMEAELQRLDDLIGEILLYARLGEVKQPNRCPTDIIDLIQNIADDASLEGAAGNKEIEVTGPEGLILSLDSGMIQSAIENVIRNAVHFTPPDTTVEVEVSVDGDDLQIVIEDRGPGVPEADLDRLFEPFFRAADAHGAKTGGVGLAIAERSVRLHGGKISANNRKTGGLRVSLSLPIVASNIDATPG